MNSTDSRRTVTALSYDTREVEPEEEQRRTVTEIVEDWSLLVQDIDDTLTVANISDTITVTDIEDDLIVTGTPVSIGDYDDDIDR